MSAASPALFQTRITTAYRNTYSAYSFTVKKTDADGNPLAGATFSLTGTGNSDNTNNTNNTTSLTKPNKPTEFKSPQTGDSSMMALWIALLFVSGAGITVVTIYKLRKSILQNNA